MGSAALAVTVRFIQGSGRVSDESGGAKKDREVLSEPGKSTQKRRKHGVTFHETATAFGDPLALTYQDPDHSIHEQRFLTVGMSNAGRL
jgi:hypothetical protein